MINLPKSLLFLFLIILCLACSRGDGREERKPTDTDNLWKTYSLPHYRSIYHLSFISHHGGWATGERGGIFSYNGSEWMQIAVPTKEQLFALSFSGENKCYTVGSRGTVLLYLSLIHI